MMRSTLSMNGVVADDVPGDRVAERRARRAREQHDHDDRDRY